MTAQLPPRLVERAFPTTANGIQPGMSLRDYFAGVALGGVLSGAGAMVKDEFVAERCYALADAMLRARG